MHVVTNPDLVNSGGDILLDGYEERIRQEKQQ